LLDGDSIGLGGGCAIGGGLNLGLEIIGVLLSDDALCDQELQQQLRRIDLLLGESRSGGGNGADQEREWEDFSKGHSFVGFRLFPALPALTECMAQVTV
jgi:hypothetical protein